MSIHMRFGVCLFAALFCVLSGNLLAQDFFASGGDGDEGGQGGDVELKAGSGIRAGGRAKVKSPRDPKMTTKATLVAQDLDVDLDIEVDDLDASPADLDPDLFEVTTSGNFLVQVGTTLDVEGDVVITSTQGGIYVAGTIQDGDGSDDGVDIELRSIRKQVYIIGDIDIAGEDAVNGGQGGSLDLNGLLVSIGGSATVSTNGGATTAAGDGGDGGNITVESFQTVIMEKKAIIGFGENTTVNLSGGSGDQGGNGGDLDVDYTNVARARLALTGIIDVSGGVGINGGSQGGDGGDIEVDAGSIIGLAGIFDARGGSGSTGALGGDGGRIRIGRRLPPAKKFDILGQAPAANPPVTVDVSGGAGLVDFGEQGGTFEIESDQKTIDWVGSIDASGGATADGDGADGGEVFITTYGSKKADIRFTGNITTAGSDAGTNGEGNAGGDIEIISLDGAIAFTGDIDTSAGDSVGNNDANGAGGNVSLVVDDLSVLPNSDPFGVELLDNVGKTVLFNGNIMTDGGNGGGGDSDGTNAGNVTIDSDTDDGEQKTNGGGTLADNSAISAVGGNGTGNGANGDGGDVTMRGSNRKLDNATPSGFVVGTGTSITAAAGTGGSVAGTAGTVTTD